MPLPKFSPAQTDSIILGQMLETNDFISGSSLAKTINTSRFSIWSHLEKLRKEGFEFEAVRNRGYRIHKLPPHLHSSLLKAYLSQLKVSAPLVFLDETDSTNSEAARQILHGIKTPAFIVAKKQTTGRGRQGRKWESSDSCNLYCSFAVKPNMPSSQTQAISLWIALSLCHLIKTHYNLPVQMKWPNDIVINKKKISGFLAEARIHADRTLDFIFGIGININSNPTNWPTHLQQTATSLASHAFQPLNINAASAQFMQCILHAYKKFISNSYKNRLQDLWKQYDSLYQKNLNAYQGSTTLSGKALGIDDSGALKLLLNDGTTKILNKRRS